VDLRVGDRPCNFQLLLAKMSAGGGILSTLT
jgi:hypothetical protein